jgi:hypothetical protein
MDKSEENDPIEKLLREQDDYIADEGFTFRVIKKLPRRRRPWLRPVILLSAAALGAVLAWQWLPLNEMPPLDFSTMKSNPSAQAAWITAVAVVGAISWAVKTALNES